MKAIHFGIYKRRNRHYQLIDLIEDKTNRTINVLYRKLEFEIDLTHKLKYWGPAEGGRMYTRTLSDFSENFEYVGKEELINRRHL